MKRFAASFMVAAALASPQLRAQQQSHLPALDVAGGFTAIRANAGPTDCGCFFMYGGSGQAVLRDPSGLGLMFEFGYTKTSNINNGAHNLALSTYLAGAQYAFHSKSRFTPFGEGLIGAAHSKTNFLIDQQTTTAAFAAGGGVDLRLSSRFDLRLLDAQYLLTHVPNGQGNSQNQLRLTTGILFHVLRSK